VIVQPRIGADSPGSDDGGKGERECPRKRKQRRPTRHWCRRTADFYLLRETLTAGEQAIAKQVRTFMEPKVAPVINQYWADDAFPFELLPAFKELKAAALA
jgi:hypothetical protein